MLSSSKPLQLVLSAAVLGAFSQLASAIEPVRPVEPGPPVEPGEPGEKGWKKAANYDAEFTDEDAAKVKELFARVVSTGEAECCTATKAACSSEPAVAVAAASEGECSAASAACNHEEPWESLSQMLAWKPAAWEVVKPMAMARFDGEASETQRRNVLSLLAWQYSLPSVTIASEIAEAHPETEFSQDQLIAFAEAGSKRFQKRVAQLQASEHGVMPSAFLALHGERAGIETLQAAVAGPFEPERATQTYVAALALYKLGQPEHLEAVRAGLHDAALGALDAGDVQGAARIALTGEFLHEACSSYKTARLSFLDTRREWHCRERAKEIGSADDVFALVEHLSAL